LAPESRISAIPLKLLFLACFRARDSAASERLYLKALDYKFRNAAAAKNQCHREVPLASEACLSGAEILTQLDRRLGRLRCVANSTLPCGTYREGLCANCTETHRRGSGNSLRAQINFHTPIEWERRTLSPSAFGFQNAKRCPDGRLVFFDLEYPLG